MKIAFVIKAGDIAEPLGIMYLSSLLQSEGHTVKLFIAAQRGWLGRLTSFSPDAVAYSVISGSQKDYLRINRLVKDHMETLSIFGGPHPTFFPEIINEKGVDLICVGEGEQAIRELARSYDRGGAIHQIRNMWIKEKNRIHQNGVRPLIQNLDELPFPDRNIVYRIDPYLQKSKIKRFIVGRGCPFNCTYCFNRAYKEIYKGEKVIRWRSVRNVIDEIKEVKANFPLEIVRFIDDIFILPPISWLQEFMKTYRREIDLPFVCNLQVKVVTEEKVQLLKAAGCMSVYMAIETGNDRIRKDLLNRNMSKTEIINAFDLLHQYGIPVGAENILGLPGGSFKTDLETLALNVRCKVDNPISTVFQPYPRTKLGEYTVQQGYFDGDFDALDASYFRGSPLNCFTKRDKRKIENLHKFFGLTVNHPKLLPLVKLLIHLPPNPIFRMIHRFWDSYRKRVKIFNVRYTFGDYLSAIYRLFRY